MRAAIALSMYCMTSSAQITEFDGSAERGIWSPVGQQIRRKRAKAVRLLAADDQAKTPVSSQPNNGDDKRYADRRGSFTKSLLHDCDGLVDCTAYQTLLDALTSGCPSDFNAITMGGSRKLTDPQASYSFSLEGADAAINVVIPAPNFSSAQMAGEMVELYWQAILRDVPFNKYPMDIGVNYAINDLNALSDFRGPRQSGEVTPATLFRLNLPGVSDGPFISQFLYLPIPNLGGVTEQVKLMPLSGQQNDFLTNFDDWFTVQNGGTLNKTIQFSDSPTFIRTGRDLGDWVHLDYPIQAFLDAALILSSFGAAALDNNHPYKSNPTQTGFVSYGVVDLLNLVSNVTQASLKATWYQKWLVHRRVRPEEFGFFVNEQIVNNTDYGIHQDLKNSFAIVAMGDIYGNLFLPQQYPEGCPTHPSYPCGHGVLAGACATILKAWFNEAFVIPNPVKPNANNNQLVSYDLSLLTVGGELNKLVSNIAKGRDIAGVHFRSDCQEGLALGEAIALSILEDEAYTKNINFSGFTLTKFDGTVITVGAKKLIVV